MVIENALVHANWFDTNCAVKFQIAKCILSKRWPFAAI